MNSRRLDRLARLTRGAALVTLGAGVAACSGPPHVNSPRPDTAANESADAASPTSAPQASVDAGDTKPIVDAGPPEFAPPAYTNAAPQQPPPAAKKPGPPKPGPPIMVNSPPQQRPKKP